MQHQAIPLRVPNPGFGLGLRTQHYPDFLAAKQPLDWLEIITDNFLVAGGRPLQMLDTIRQDYPVVMHGVAMSIGAAHGLDTAYLKQVKQLADRVQPLWVSDHLCWIGARAQEHLHDLYPLPYTDEAAQRVINHIQQAQDVLGRRLVIENVSSYVSYTQSACAEWQFLSHIAQAADCLLLVDVNNIYVSSVNHSFKPLDYLQGLPAQRVQQIHLAGHSMQDDLIIDTHDHAVSPAVWALYAQACQQFGAVATMIERDDHIPSLAELLDELSQARKIQTESIQVKNSPPHKPFTSFQTEVSFAATLQGALFNTQHCFADYVLGKSSVESMLPLIQPDHSTPTRSATTRLNVYHHAYRARLAEVLADSFEKTYLFMGSNQFDIDAKRFSVTHPPRSRSLNDFGAGFAQFLYVTYPNNSELFELASLDWALRQCFATADIAPLTAQAATTDTGQSWLHRQHCVQPALQLLPVNHNIVAIWNAIDTDNDVPALETLVNTSHIMVWRKQYQPHFQTIDASQAVFFQHLISGASIAETADVLASSEQLSDPALLGQWLNSWWLDGVLCGDVAG